MTDVSKVANSNTHQNAVNILIVDDHRLFADGLSRLLETLDRPVQLSQCYTGAQAIEQLENNHFDLLLVDLLMPDIDGASLLKAINTRKFSTTVAIVSSTEDIQLIGHLMRQGAAGFIPKSASSEIMLDAVSSLLKGDIVLPDELWEHLDIINANSNDDAPPSSFHSLGTRQLEVLELMAEGKTNKQICAILAISEATVKYHVGILFRSLGVKNRTACVTVAQSHKLVKSSDGRHHTH